MREQSSLEFMVYLGLSVASLAVSLSFFIPYYSGMQRTGAALQFGDFSAALNNAMSYSSAGFVAVVPAGLCNSTVENGAMSSAYGTFQLDGSVAFSGALCNTSGLTALTLQRQPDGGFLVGG